MSLEDKIKTCLTIPLIGESGAIMDGSFTTEPYITDSLRGSGEPTSISLFTTVNLFYRTKADAVSNGIKLYKSLNSESGIFTDEPDFTWESEAQYWRTSLRVQEVIENGS